MTEIPGWKPGDPIRVLPFGPSKVGKTFGAGTWPRPVFMDFDRGIDTIFSPDFLKVHGYKNVQHREFYERTFKGPIVNAHNAYDAWVIDSATTLSEDAQNKAVILLGTKDYNYQSKTHEQALKHNLLVPKIQDYGAERSLVEQFVDMVLSTNKNVVLICHEYEQTDDEGNVIGVQPLLTGKSRQAVPLRFSEVYWLRKVRQGLSWITKCTTHADGLHLVGSRTGVADEIQWTYADVRQGLVNAYDERVKQITAAKAAADKAAATPVAPRP